MSPSARFAAVGFALVYPTILTVVYFVGMSDAAPLVQQAVYGVGKAVQFGFPLVWVVLVAREKLEIGWPNLRGVGVGVVFALVVSAVMGLVYFFWWKPAGLFDEPARLMQEKMAGFNVDTPARFLLLGVFYSLIHSLLEEYYWRWFVFGRLRRLVALPAAIVVSSLGFMAHHVIVLGLYFQWQPLPTAFFSLSVAVGGLFWAWLYHHSRSLYSVWLSHLIIDAAIFLAGYDMMFG